MYIGLGFVCVLYNDWLILSVNQPDHQMYTEMRVRGWALGVYSGVIHLSLVQEW